MAQTKATKEYRQRCIQNGKCWSCSKLLSIEEKRPIKYPICAKCSKRTNRCA